MMAAISSLGAVAVGIFGMVVSKSEIGSGNNTNFLPLY
jgi:hypothetical protein